MKPVERDRQRLRAREPDDARSAGPGGSWRSPRSYRWGRARRASSTGVPCIGASIEASALTAVAAWVWAGPGRGLDPCRVAVAVALVDDLAVGRVLAGFVEDALPELGESARAAWPLRRCRRRRPCRRASRAIAVEPPPCATEPFSSPTRPRRRHRRPAGVGDLGQEQPLADRPEAAGDEVDAQARGHLVEHDTHEDHHVLHHLLLHLGLGRRGRRREELGLDEHQARRPRTAAG